MDPDGNWAKEIGANIQTMLWDPVDGARLIMVLKGGILMSVTVPDITMGKIGTFDGRVWETIVLP
jgi:hypothetical protein